MRRRVAPPAWRVLADLSAFVHDSTVAPGLDCPQTRSRSGESRMMTSFAAHTGCVDPDPGRVGRAGTRDSRRRGHGWSGRKNDFSPRSRSRKNSLNVAAPDTQIVLPEAKRYAGDWSLAGAEAALDRALADRDVDVVLAIGILTSQQAARRKSLPKPVDRSAGHRPGTAGISADGRPQRTPQLHLRRRLPQRGQRSSRVSRNRRLQVPGGAGRTTRCWPHCRR